MLAGREPFPRQALAELPFIQLDEGDDYPSVVCRGISNKIAASGAVTEELLQDHRELNDLCHAMTFGLMAVDRATMERHPKESLAFLGRQR